MKSTIKNSLLKLLVLSIFTFSLSANAGQDNRSNCIKELSPEQKATQLQDRGIRTPREIEMAFKLLDVLESSGAELAIIGRTGSKLSDRKFTYPNGRDWKIQYTHAGIAIKTDEGWYFDHQLNTCAGPTSDLYRQSLLAFFQDKSLGHNAEYLYNTEVIIPSKELQIQIKNVLNSGLRDSLHERRYNKIAYPFSLIEKTGPIYQNSNQWLLEIVAAAQMQLQGYNKKITRTSAQRYLKNNNYLPTISKLSKKEMIFGVGFGVGSGKNTKFDDQPAGFDVKPIWVSVESIAGYLEQSNSVISQMSLCLGKEAGEFCE